MGHKRECDEPHADDPRRRSLSERSHIETGVREIQCRSVRIVAGSSLDSCAAGDATIKSPGNCRSQ